MRLILLAARLLVLLLAFQLSGLDWMIVGSCCSSGDDCTGQTGDDPCNDCPPQCPKCDCSDIAFSLPPAREAVRFEPTVHPEWDPPVVWTPYEADAPRAPPQSSIFRPPKTRFAA